MKKFKEILVKLNNWKFIILIILIIGEAFYWFQWRPSQIIKRCQFWSMNEATDQYGHPATTREEALYFFGKCMRQYGIDR